MRIGEAFAGIGGLGLGVHAATVLARPLGEAHASERQGRLL